jgi:hypothetical protein
MQRRDFIVACSNNCICLVLDWLVGGLLARCGTGTMVMEPLPAREVLRDRYPERTLRRSDLLCTIVFVQQALLRAVRKPFWRIHAVRFREEKRFAAGPITSVHSPQRTASLLYQHTLYTGFSSILDILQLVAQVHGGNDKTCW